MYEKGIEATDIIYKQKLDSLSSARLNLLEKNTHLQELLSKKEPRGASHNEVDTLPPPNLLFQIISVGGAKAVSLPATAPIT